MFTRHGTVVQAREVVTCSKLIEEKLPNVRRQSHCRSDNFIVSRHFPDTVFSVDTRAKIMASCRRPFGSVLE